MRSLIVWLTLVEHVLGAQHVRLATFNTGLTTRVPEYETRRQYIGPALQETNADIVCLQEVWLSSDMQMILDHVTTGRFPYSYSALHSGVSHMRSVSPVHAPCLSSEFVLDFLPCLFRKCGGTSGQSKLTCAEEQCGMSTELSQACVTCLVLADPASIRSSCVSNAGEAFNVPGLLLLSNSPLRNARVVPFESSRKIMLLPRSYIAAEVDGLGTVVCTHTTANLGPSYFEVLPYNSWLEQNVAEAHKLVISLEDASHAVVMGDLNSSPAVFSTLVAADFEESYQYLVSEGFQPAYISRLGVCTWCPYNRLTKDTTPLILDHVLVKNLRVSSARRIMDMEIAGHNFTLSDHFGIQVTVLTADL